MTHPASGQNGLPHLRLTPIQVFELWQSGNYTPKGYLYHLVLAHRRAGWWWRIDNVSEFCQTWDIKRRTFYRAKAALIQEGIFEESITGSIELRVSSALHCVTSAAGVPTESQRVPDLAQPVPTESQVAAETIAPQELQDPTDLIQIFKQLPTIEGVCVPVENFSLEEEQSKGILPTQSEEEVKNQNFQADSEKLFTPPILQRAKKLGVNVRDRSLLSVVKRWPERVSMALDCLEEKSLTAKYPTRFLQKAIEYIFATGANPQRPDWLW